MSLNDDDNKGAKRKETAVIVRRAYGLSHRSFLSRPPFQRVPFTTSPPLAPTQRTSADSAPAADTSPEAAFSFSHFLRRASRDVAVVVLVLKGAAAPLQASPSAAAGSARRGCFGTLLPSRRRPRLATTAVLAMLLYACVCRVR